MILMLENGMLFYFRSYFGMNMVEGFGYLLYCLFIIYCFGIFSVYSFFMLVRIEIL